MIVRSRLAAPPDTGPIELPRWAYPATKPGRFKSAYGGRGAARTTTFARLIIIDSLQNPDAVYACGREFQSSIRVSSKVAIEKAIRDLGVRHLFEITKHEIFGHNGTHFFFTGIERNPDNIRGWEKVKICWIEEAERLTHETANTLVPTIREEGSELWFSWNPKDRGSWIYVRTIINPRPGDIAMFATYADNPWFPKELEEERQAMKKEDPELYAHVWEGLPFDEGAEKRFLPYALLQDCIDAWSKRPKHIPGRSDSGFDVADTGVDKNAYVNRKGPCLNHAEEWRAKTVTESTLRVHGLALDHNAHVVCYDRQAVGAEARRTFADLDAEGKRTYRVVPEQFGAEVKGKARRYSFKTKNEDMFLRRNSQMAWTLRLRANNTRRLMHGEKVDPMLCLFINPEIPRIERLLTQLCQPKWEFSQTGRIQTLKKDEKELSPDLFDATCLAFSQDSRYGLKAD